MNPVAFTANKYQRWYFQLVERAQLRGPIVQYTERHHILPKAFGGTNCCGNIVRLTFREHFLVHWLLVKFTQGKDKRQMYSALIHSAETLKKMSISHKGKGHTAESKAKIAVASRARMLGTKLSEETKRKIGEASARYHAARRAALFAKANGHKPATEAD